MPQLVPSRLVGGHHHVGHALQRVHRGGQVLERISIGARFRQEESGVRRGKRVGQTVDPADEVESAGQEQFGRLEAPDVETELGGGDHRGIDGVEREEGRHAFPYRRHEPEAGGGDHAEGALAATEEGREVVAGVVPHEAAQVGDD